MQNAYCDVHAVSCHFEEPPSFSRYFALKYQLHI